MKQRDRELLDRKFKSEGAMSYPDTHKLPPQNIEAEQSVLGGMLIDDKAISEVEEIIVPDDFYRDAHRKIFTAIVDLNNKSINVDLVTLTNELQKRDQLDATGGASYVVSLLESTPTAANIGYHAAIVKEKSVLRAVIQAATEIIAMTYGDEQELNAILAMFQKSSSELIEKSGIGKRAKKLEISSILSRIGSLRETPYRRINDAITGFLGKELIAVAGRPNFGKTSFVCGLLTYTAMVEKRPAIYFGTAFSKERFEIRLISSITGIPFNDLIRGNTPSEQAPKVLAAQKALEAAPIRHVIEPETLNVMSVIAEARRVKAELGDLGIIVIENLQELKFPGKFRSRKEELDAIAAALTDLTDKIETPIVLSCQIERRADEREDGIPTLGDIKDTGAVGEKAIKVFLLYRPVYYQNLKKGIETQESPEPAKVIIAKGGPVITISLYFDGRTYSWRDVD